MRLRSRLVVGCALLCLASLSAALPAEPRDDLAGRLERVMARPAFRHAIFGVSVRSLDTGKVLYAKNADAFFVPASTTKLVTFGAALLALGPDYRFHTRVYRTGEIGADGVLAGDLVLAAAGDPNLSGRVRPDGTLAFANSDHSYGGPAVSGDPLLVVRELAAQVAAKGIRRVAGRVIVDATLFPEGERELGTGTVISPVAVNDNLVDVVAAPCAGEGAPVALRISPATSYVRVLNRATTGKPGSPPSLAYTADVAAADGTRTVTLAGSLPAGENEGMFAYAVPEPRRYAEVVLAEALQERGVVASPARYGETPDWKALAASYRPERLVAEHVSPPLAEDVKVALKVSQNLHASMMPAILGALGGSLGSALAGAEGAPAAAPNPAAAGFRRMREALGKAGVDLDGAMQGDGAGGLARFTPDFMTRLLAAMARQPFAAIYEGALPVLGRDGTLAKVQPGSPAAGHVRAKTGTDEVEDPLHGGVMLYGKGLAGYATTAAGRRLAFAIYVNNVELGPEPGAVQAVAGQALGEMAAAVYEAR